MLLNIRPGLIIKGLIMEHLSQPGIRMELHCRSSFGAKQTELRNFKEPFVPGN